MKAVKLSLAAALVASSAFAVDLGSFKDVKVGGQLKAWYETTQNEAESTGALFSQGSARGQAMAKVTLDGKIGEKIGFGATGVYIDTLGLENNLVADVAVAGVPGGLKSQQFMQEAFMTYATHKTIAKIGRQKLDTPLAFSEDWNLVENSFEAAVLINKDLPDTILVGAYVSEGNGNGAANKYVIADQGKFSSYVLNGARAVGAINTSIQGVTAQAWYYDVVSAAKAFWLQADAKVPNAPYGLTVGAQYANVDADQLGLDATSGYALKVGASASGVDAFIAYSSVDSSNGLSLGNTATAGKKTKLYTASIFSDGTIAAQPDVNSYKVGASTAYAGVKFAASYGYYDVGSNGGQVRAWATTLPKQEVQEIDLSASAKLADVNLALYYMNRSSDITSNTYNHDTIRIIASLDF